MRRLLSANIVRLRRDKTFWIIVLVMISIELSFCFMIKQEDVPMDIILFISLQSIGILSSISYSLFLGTEYNDGTLRNKIIVGHKRSDIYLASFFTGAISIIVIFLAGVLTGGIIGSLIFASPSHSFGQIILAGGIGLLASISYIAIFNFVGMLSSNKAKTSIICLLIAFLLVFAGMICFSLLSYTENALLQFLFEFNPVGQMMQMVPMTIASPMKLVFYALSLSCTLNVFGLYFFNKKDLK